MQNQVAVLKWAAFQGSSLLLYVHSIRALLPRPACQGMAGWAGLDQSLWAELCDQHSGSAKVSDCEYRSFFHLCPTVIS